MNEETMIEKQPVINGQQGNKHEASWKHITLGGVSGILMGAGLMYAGQTTAANATDDEADNTAPADEQQTEGASAASLPVGQMHNDLSFGEAFATARAEVGPGGVFIWHGGIYNTYTAEEWNAMTAEQKSDFAHQVNPEVRAHAVPTPTDEYPDVTVHPVTDAAAQPANDAADVRMVEQQIAENFDMGEDVHIVGYADADGHLAVGYDINGDGQTDIAIIDMDDNLQPSDADIIVDRNGNMATLGELSNDPNSNMEAYNDAPDMADNAQADFDFPVIEV